MTAHILSIPSHRATHDALVAAAAAKPYPAQSLTVRQREFLHAVALLTVENGYPPSLREVAAQVGMTSSGHASYHRDQLAKRGLLAFDTYTPRSLCVTVIGWEAIRNDTLAAGFTLLETITAATAVRQATETAKRTAERSAAQ